MGLLHTTLGAIAEFTNGGAWNQSEYTAQGVPVVRVSDIKDETVDLADCKFLPESLLERYRKHVLRQGDLVVCTVGSHPTQPGSVVGRTAIILQTAQGALLNQNAVCIRSATQEVDERWLGHLGRSKQFRDYIISCARGSANQVRMAIGLLKEMPIALPTLTIQRRIADILSAYDDLIENNTRRIKILEEMARAIYHEWFVHFRFPGHEKVKLINSPLGKIPQGWEVKRLAGVCDIVMGQSPKSEFYNEMGEGLPFHQGVTDFGDRFPVDRVYCTVENRIAEKDDILFSVRAPVGRLNVANKKIIIGRGLSAIRSKTGHQPFMFLQLKEKFQEEDAMGGGTIFKAVTKEEVQRIEILVPPEFLVDRFEEFVRPMFSNLEVLTTKNTQLRATRDLLLSKLISGEVDMSADGANFTQMEV